MAEFWWEWVFLDSSDVHRWGGVHGGNGGLIGSGGDGFKMVGRPAGLVTVAMAGPGLPVPVAVGAGLAVSVGCLLAAAVTVVQVVPVHTGYRCQWCRWCGR